MDEEPYDDSIEDPIAELDQAIRGMRDLGRVIRAFYDAMIEQNFTDAQALQLTGSYIGNVR